MTSKQFLGWVACAASVAALASVSALGTGCGKGSTTGAGGATSTTGSGVTNTTGTKMVTSSSSTGSTSTGGGSGHDINSAVMVNINDPATMGTFVDATMTHDFYSFTGMAGERIVLVVLATGAQTGANPAATDPAFSLIGSGKDPTKPLTYQTGGWPNFGQAATLFVQLPVTGTYYVDMSDCNAFFMSGCPNPASGVSDLGYSFGVFDTSKLTVPETLATAANTMGSPSVVKYTAGTMAGQYDDNVLGGAFAAAGETHVFSFTPPAGSAAAAGAVSRAEFYIQPIGTGGQGGDLSDANIKVWITDSTGKQIAADDQNNYPTNSTTYTPLEFSTPFTAGSTYYLYVQNTQAAGSKLTSFYFIDHYLNPLIDVAEKGTGLNTHATSATAEALTAQGTAKDFFTVDGTIAAVTAPADVDFYSMVVPAAKTQFQLSCDSARSGSGLGGFVATLYQSDGTTSFATGTESTTMDLITMAANIPAAVTAGSTIYLKATATAQDATNTGNAYRCYVFFQ